MALKQVIFSSGHGTPARDFGLLILRLGIGGLMLGAHGWSKLQNYSNLVDKFPDPIGVGSQMSLILAIGAEVGCAALLIVGLAARLATIPLITTMVVAAFIVHADDPFKKQEFALVYLIPFVTLFFTGPGRFSADAYIGGNR